MDTVGEFDAIFAEYHERLVRYLGRILGDRALGQDLAQETLLRVYKAGEQLRKPEARTAWIYRIATNLALDQLRRRRGAEARWESVEASEDVDGVATAAQDSANEEGLEQEEMAACLRARLHKLPDTLRACLILRDVEGLGEKPAAEALGCSVGAVKLRTHRARKKLREQLHRGCHFQQDGRGVLRCEGCHFHEDAQGILQCEPAGASSILGTVEATSLTIGGGRCPEGTASTTRGWCWQCSWWR